MAAEDALYPELALHGQLAGAIQAAAAELALDLGTVAPGYNPRRGASVASSVPGPGAVPMSIRIGAVERWFLIDGLDREGQLVSGATQDLREVVRAAPAWRRDASLAEIQQAAPFVVSGRAFAHRRDPADLVAERWLQLRVSWGRDDRFPLVSDLIEAAYAVPQLRQLYPYTSHFALCFSMQNSISVALAIRPDSPGVAARRGRAARHLPPPAVGRRTPRVWMCAHGSELYDPSWHAWVVIGGPGGRHSAGKIFGIDLDAVVGERPLRPVGPGRRVRGSAVIKDLLRLRDTRFRAEYLDSEARGA